MNTTMPIFNVITIIISVIGLSVVIATMIIEKKNRKIMELERKINKELYLKVCIVDILAFFKCKFLGKTIHIYNFSQQEIWAMYFFRDALLEEGYTFKNENEYVEIAFNALKNYLKIEREINLNNCYVWSIDKILDVGMRIRLQTLSEKYIVFVDTQKYFKPEVEIDIINY